MPLGVMGRDDLINASLLIPVSECSAVFHHGAPTAKVPTDARVNINYSFGATIIHSVPQRARRS